MPYPGRMQGRGVSPIGYLGLGEGLRGGEGALRKAISIGGCEGVTRGSSIVGVAPIADLGVYTFPPTARRREGVDP